MHRRGDRSEQAVGMQAPLTNLSVALCLEKVGSWRVRGEVEGGYDADFTRLMLRTKAVLRPQRKMWKTRRGSLAREETVEVRNPLERHVIVR